MNWNDKNKALLLRQLYVFEPWEYEYKSPERSQIWEEISDSLDGKEFEGTMFHLSGGAAVRSRVQEWMKDYERKLKVDRKITGDPGKAPTEYDQLIEEIYEFFRADFYKKEKGKNTKETKEVSSV